MTDKRDQEIEKYREVLRSIRAITALHLESYHQNELEKSVIHMCDEVLK